MVAAPESPFWLQSYCKSPLDGTGQCQIDLYQIILGTRNLAFSNGQGNFLNRNLPYSPECGLGAECQGCFIQTSLSVQEVGPRHSGHVVAWLMLPLCLRACRRADSCYQLRQIAVYWLVLFPHP